MMINIRDILTFVITNSIGFFAAPIIYHLAIMVGIFSPAMVESNTGAFQSSFFSGTLMTWAVCALISISFFFIDGKLRALIMALPILVPLIYGFNVLLGFASVS